MYPRSVYAVLAAAGLLGVLLTVGLLPGTPSLLVDEALLLDEAGAARIEQAHAELLANYDIDYRVLTTEKASDIDGFAVAQFRALDVGSLSDSGRGLLLVVDPAHDRVRLEVGYALEGVFPDSFAGAIQRDQMLPFFQRRRVADGIVATTELIVARAEEAGRQGMFAPTVQGTGGGGAVARALIGAEAANMPTSTALESDVAAKETPEATVAAYIDAMARYDARADLGIYTAATQAMLRGWVMTRAQMRNVASADSACGGGNASIEGDLAVVQYDAASETCSPYFLRREDGRWRLDLVAMQQLVRFDNRNRWHMPSGGGDFAFAFR